MAKKMEPEIEKKEQTEQIVEVEVERLREFKGHPFKVEDDLDIHSL